MKLQSSKALLALFLRALVLLPMVAGGWPAFLALDGPLLAHFAILLSYIALAAVHRDPISTQSKEGSDRRSQALLGLGFYFGILIGTLDLGRWHALGPVPAWLRWTAVLALALAYALRIWAVIVNRYFSDLLVIQRDRGHAVVDRGPYAFVRHPGYLALFVILPSTAFALGSYLALLPLLLACCVLYTRTRVEDRFLLAELEGYAEYARRVRFMLIPGVY